LTGLPDATQADSVRTTMARAPFAELERLETTFAGQTLYEATYTRDALGRITHVDELMLGQARSVTYGYDAADRLALVDVAGEPARNYYYDANGNLEEVHEDGILVLSPSYDDQDRQLTYGALSFTYAPSGHLETRTDTS